MEGCGTEREEGVEKEDEMLKSEITVQSFAY